MSEAIDRPRLKPRIYVTPKEMQDWLEWAGARLLSLHIKSPYPKEYASTWPAYTQDFNEAYGWTNERLRPATPNQYEIELMDKILLFPGLISDQTQARIVQARSLVTPISQRYLYSWTKIGFMLHMERRRVRALYEMGLREITEKLPSEKAYAVRRLLSILTTLA